MSATLLFCICLAYFALAYFVYGGFLKKLFAIDPNRPTPAVTEADGIDFVPTPAPVLFGHHFASIAGPGPIVGPIMAAYFGWLPALIWILVGCVFVGAFHDFASLVISLRNKGRSVSFVMEKMMGFTGRQLFLSFCLLCLLLVVAIFTLLIAGLFTAFPEVATSSIFFIILAPLFSLVTLKFGVSLKIASCVFIPLVFFGVYLGQLFPCDLKVLFDATADAAQVTADVKAIWIAVLALYIFAASVMPVQWLLQPRDYMNSWLLYAMLALGFASILAFQPDIKMEAFTGFEAVTGDGKMTNLVPALFIFIACGACSGFHALVASGTTSKQLDNEKHALPIGYGAMLIEGVLGIMALVAVMSMDHSVFVDLGKNPPKAFATGISGFCAALGLNVQYAMTFISLAISAFMMTSLDTATRLGRFICQELFMPRAKGEDQAVDVKAINPLRKVLLNKYVASAIIVLSSVFLATSGEAPALWPIFGASNQLMSAITLLVISLWLLSRNVNWLVAFIPMLFMTVMSLWGVIQVVQQQWNSNGVLVGIGLVLVVMDVLMVIIGISVISHHFKKAFSKQ